LCKLGGDSPGGGFIRDAQFIEILWHAFRQIADLDEHLQIGFAQAESNN